MWKAGMNFSYIPTRLCMGCCIPTWPMFQHSQWHLWSHWRHKAIYLFAFSPEETWTVWALTVEMSGSCQYLVTIFASSATNPTTQRRYPELSVIKPRHKGPERLWDLYSWKNSKLNWTKPKQPAFTGPTLSKGSGRTRKHFKPVLSPNFRETLNSRGQSLLPPL